MTRAPLGLVTIRRKKGRIAGFGAPRIPVQTLWCGTNRPRKKFGKRANGWSFPPAVRELLLQECVGKTVLHLFGGRADFGFRLDIDPSTQPDVIGDAWLPPFDRDSFDVVILDPPYFTLQQQEKLALMRIAAWIARERVYWFHTIWIPGDRSLALEKAWLIRVGDQCAVRCLEVFSVREPKIEPPRYFERGPAMKYNRWLQGQQELALPFDAQPSSAANDSPVITPNVDMEPCSAGVKSRVYQPARSANGGVQ